MRKIINFYNRWRERRLRYKVIKMLLSTSCNTYDPAQAISDSKNIIKYIKNNS